MTKRELRAKGLSKKAEDLILHRASNLKKMFGTSEEAAITIMFNTLDRPAYNKL